MDRKSDDMRFLPVWVATVFVICACDAASTAIEPPTVYPPLITIVMSPTSAALERGDSLRMTVSSSATSTFAWFSTDSSIAAVQPFVGASNQATVVARDRLGRVDICAVAAANAAVRVCSTVFVNSE